MSAVIRTGGKQYRVEVGQHVVIERLSGEAGDAVSFDDVLSTGDGESIVIGTPTVEGVSVHGTIIEQKRSRKILVFRRKRRKNFRRLNSHRQYQSVVEITAIGGSAPKAAKKPAKKADAPKAEAPMAEAPKAKAPKAAAPKAEAASTGKLTDLKGFGPAMEKKFNSVGITTLQQVADMDAAQMADVDEKLALKGRIEKDGWIAQAKDLLK